MSASAAVKIHNYELDKADRSCYENMNINGIIVIFTSASDEADLCQATRRKPVKISKSV